MNLHLAEIAKAVASGTHAVLLVDQAGWHLSAGLLIPANITILALPPKCPELNPVENIWQYATTGSRTASSNPTTISSITAATPGIPLSTDPGRSCPSDCANGRTSSDQ
jgi:DDE superfamily endonuclease